MPAIIEVEEISWVSFIGLKINSALVELLLLDN